MANTTQSTWATRRVELVKVALKKQTSLQKSLSELQEKLQKRQDLNQWVKSEDAYNEGLSIRVAHKLPTGVERLLVQLAINTCVSHEAALSLIDPPITAFSFYSHEVIPGTDGRTFNSWYKQISAYFKPQNRIYMNDIYSEGDVWIRVGPDSNKEELQDFIARYYDSMAKHLVPMTGMNIHNEKLLNRNSKVRPLARDASAKNKAIISLKKEYPDNSSSQLAKRVEKLGWSTSADDVRRVLNQQRKEKSQRFRIL